MADSLGITLLDSFIVIGDDCRPESLYTSEHIYPLMRAGKKITTAQASTFERHQHYQSICQQFGPALYLCVGSAFTGNYNAAVAWKDSNVLGQSFTIIDTGAASGRLAVIGILTARRAKLCSSEEELIDEAQQIIAKSHEYVFINELKYLVAGGRVSRSGGFFGDLLHMKPVITPTMQGVKKIGVVHSTAGQLAFALEKLEKHCRLPLSPLILLQYSDNEDWVASTVQPRVRSLLPQAEILLSPLSLTSGVHMGPGTWSVAFALPPATPGESQDQ